MYYTKIIDDEDMNQSMFEYLRDFDYEFIFESDNLIETKYSNNLLGVSQFNKFVKIVEKFTREKTIEIFEDSHSYNPYKDFNRDMKILAKNLYVRSQKCFVMWGLRNKSGDSFSVHNHWPSTWSFSYYLNPPEGASGLYFPDNDEEVKIEHGLLILFKGDTLHGVKKSNYDGYRYCVSGNISPKFHA